MKELEASLVQAQPDPRDISKHMQMIMKSTSKAVTKIQSSYRYTSFVEYRATGLEDVTELSAIVFGDTREEEILNSATSIRIGRSHSVGPPRGFQGSLRSPRDCVQWT
jgi:hypothetical protein